MILQEILLLVSSFKRVQQQDFHTDRICTSFFHFALHLHFNLNFLSSFFLCCKTKTVI